MFKRSFVDRSKVKKTEALSWISGLQLNQEGFPAGGTRTEDSLTLFWRLDLNRAHVDLMTLKQRCDQWCRGPQMNCLTCCHRGS